MDDEQLVDTDVPTVGERLRAARDAKKLSLEDIAAQTRIPQRHLESLETSSWGDLPAPTYTVGFAKSYATAVGLDRAEISESLREEMGGQRFTASVPAEVFEPADPARTMPKWLVLGAIAAVILLVVLMSWLNRRSLEQPDAPVASENVAAPAPMPSPPPAATVGQGPVTVTAISPVWVSIYELSGAKLFEGVLAANQTYTVPATAVAPMLRTGKPEAIRINVGSATAPSIGPPATTVRDVSLLGPDLMRGGQGAAGAAPIATAPPSAPARTAPLPSQKPRPRPTAVASPPAPAPPAVTNSAAQ